MIKNIKNFHSIKKLMGCVILLLIILGTAIYFICSKNNRYDVTIINPTCTESGYSIYKNKSDGTTKIEDVIKAKGHQFDEWVEIVKAEDLNPGERKHKCKICGFEETENYYNEQTFPRIQFYGNLDGIGKKDRVSVSAKVSMENLSFDGYATLKYQGHSSLKYPKKNFTVNFYMDESHENKKEFEFLHWKKESKYILKANYIDTSRCRNLICADIWSEMVAKRANLNKRLSKLSNFGAVDGFPMAVYMNDKFIGTYNLTLHKDENLFGMVDGKKDGIMIINDCTNDAALFREKIDWDNTGDWEIEYCGTEDKKWIQNKINEFIDFVIKSDDEEFKKNFANYADVDSVIDYMLSMYTLGLNTSYAKDLIFITYDDSPWIASLFDMENAFGLFDDGSGFNEPTYGLPICKNKKWSSGTDSLLWDRLLQNFDKKIKVRYKKLRSESLSENNITSCAKKRIEALPSNINKADLELYTVQPQKNISHIQQIEQYVNKRAKLLDDIFSN